MKKNLILGMFAAASMLFATSCQNEKLETLDSGNEATVSFTLGVEGGVQTRAISDGKSADKLIYAVFDKDGKRVTGLQAVTKTGVTFPTTENIILAKGQTYKVAFWAQDADCDAYTVDTDAMTVAINYTDGTNTSDANNDETRDAFFKTVEFTVSNSTTINVELKRPFAQINVGVTETDWTNATTAGVEIEKSSVVIKNAANKLNLVTGTVEGETEVTYSLNAIPTETLYVDIDGDGTKEAYRWLSMSYILPNESTTGYDKTTLENVSFTFEPEAGEKIDFAEGLDAVPVQRNWRTNIIGNLLTSKIKFNIVIDPIFEDDHNVSVPYATIGNVAYKTFAEAMAAVKDGETITLQGETILDATTAGHLFSIDGKSITIDLNGYGIVSNIPNTTVATSIFQVKNGAGLTIKGNGNIDLTTGTANNVVTAFIVNEAGTVNLEGGDWRLKAGNSFTYFVDNNSGTGAATLNIFGGNYNFSGRLFRNFNNHKTEQATMKIFGGTFTSEGDLAYIQTHTANNPSLIEVTGGTYNNVAFWDMSSTTKTNEKIKISGGTFSDMWTPLYLVDGADVNIKLLYDWTMKDDIKYTIAKNSKVVLDLNGYTLSQTKTCTEGYAFITNNGQLTVKGDGKISFTDEGNGDSSYSWGTYTIKNNGNLTVESGEISLSGTGKIGYAIDNYNGATLQVNGGTITASGSNYYDGIRLFCGSNQTTVTVNDGTISSIWAQNPTPNQATEVQGTVVLNGGNIDTVYYEKHTTVKVKSGVTANIVANGNGKENTTTTAEGEYTVYKFN